ncbi:CYTH and CHAD domain-containing protein [Modestobacter muralis]|uniref:CYTH and CHAD domain-containing protein n=1 Tax=Modestobacter muralis TaxID=1608614 RepID=A0A6P0EQ09_9ACTN|nr:CYTH and CHAD domain-containing protein [Modestobacter muralis]NEK93831.1 CYTH and CHAD domain-containing protein [Modestobacter muralis]NEN50598.1 CYTH and CHAD domain-containing protein [Modestobacter muralis]
MADVQLEIEQKFDVEETFVLPDLSGVAGVAEVREPVEHHLDAAYYDTADLRLARARVTLRRRTGGTDAGWHVKLPAVAGARRELHSPVGRAARTPPKAVLEPVLGIVRQAPAAQVALLRTRRVVTELVDAEGRVLAEVADDHVTGTAYPAGPGEAAVVTTWREVEVELVDGDDAVLVAVAEALLDAGARPADSPSKLSRVLGDRLATLAPEPVTPAASPKKKGKKGKKHAPAAAAGDVVAAALRSQVQALSDADLMVRTGQADGVHQVRVACRRLRSTLAAFRPVLDRTQTDPVRAELAVVGSALSPTRDAEVAVAHLRELVAGQPPELVLGPVAARLQQLAVKDEAAGDAAARKVLSGADYLRLREDLDALVAEPPLTAAAVRPADEVLREVVARTGRRLERTVDLARDSDTDEALHDVRKAAKRLRYTAEAAVPVLGRPVAELVTAIKDVQEVLGDRQDTFVTRPLCVQLGLQAFAAGENAWTWGRLHALEQARSEESEREFWVRWPQLRPALRTATT